MVKLFQKLVGAGDIAGRLRRGEMPLYAFLFAKLFLCACGVKEKADKRFALTTFSEPSGCKLNIYHAKSRTFKPIARFFFDATGAKKKLGKKKTPQKEFRHCGGGKRACA